MNGQAGKGSAYRKVNREKFDKNYERIFRKAVKEIRDKVYEAHKKLPIPDELIW